jgi:hypothetical protein
VLNRENWENRRKKRKETKNAEEIILKKNKDSETWKVCKEKNTSDCKTSRLWVIKKLGDGKIKKEYEKMNSTEIKCRRVK